MRNASVFTPAMILVALLLGMATAWAGTPAQPPHPPSRDAEIATLKARIAALQKRVAAPDLGQQMLVLQLRHDRLWWAGQAGNWNLAYYMVGEIGEALEGIEETNGDAPQVQPQKLSVLMPSIMNPAIKGMQEGLARHDRKAFDAAFDRLSRSCTACHQAAGFGFLHIQRPRTRLLDNLRYAPEHQP